MKQLAVRYEGWGESWPLGRLADDGRTLLFEYAPEALQQGLELSPRHLKLASRAYGGFPQHLHRLPGLVADALPDGWGLLLMDRLFRQEGLAASPLARLAFLGGQAMGALSFAPPSEVASPPVEHPLLALAQASQRVLVGESTQALRALWETGGSPQGARPKALVQHDVATQEISTLAEAKGSPWLVKFQAHGEHKEVCAVEQLYAQLARACGLEMPPSACFDLSPKLAAFGVARFDREDGLRVPIHSLAGFLHADFRSPSVDYTTYLRATRMLTRDEQEVGKAYARAVFNVVFHNRDDHAKNFAFRLGRDRRWRVAPCFDLTFSHGPGGEHQAAVCGEGRRVTRAHLMRLAKEGGVDPAEAQAVLARCLEVAGQLSHFAEGQPIRRASVKLLRQALEANRLALA